MRLCVGTARCQLLLATVANFYFDLFRPQIARFVVVGGLQNFPLIFRLALQQFEPILTTLRTLRLVKFNKFLFM